MMVRCCVCGKWRILGHWYRLPVWVSVLVLRVTRVSHGYCPPCVDKARKDWGLPARKGVSNDA